MTWVRWPAAGRRHRESRPSSGPPLRGGSYGVVLDEDAELAGRDPHRVTHAESQLRVALPAHVDGQHDAEGLRVDAHLHHRAGRVDVRDFRLEARPAVAGAHDLELVRADEGRRGARLVVGVVRVGDLEVADSRPPVLHARVEDVHVAEEVHDEGVGGLLEDLLRRADLLDAPVVHDDDAVSDLEGLLLVMRDEHTGHVQLVVEPPEPLAELLAHPGVERSERLVEEEHLRLGGERACERDALALAAGKLRRQRALVPLELDQSQQLPHALADARPRRLPRAGGAEEGQQSAARDLEADLAERDERAEALRHPLDRDAHGSPPWAASRAASARSRRVFHSSAVFAKSVTSASMASTDARAKAPGRLYSWKSFSTRRGM